MSITDVKETTWNIDAIQALTEPEAQAMALEMLRIKEHNVYLVDFGGHFGFSALVFAEGRHIYYANDYELHHYEHDRAALKAAFVLKLNSALYTESEITSPIKTYYEYKNKSNYLHNYYGMRRDRVSIFAINPTAEEEARIEAAKKNGVYDPVSFAFYTDAEFVKHHIELNAALEEAYVARETDYDFLKSSFKYEMANHEYAINWQGNWDVLSCYGNIQYDHKQGDQDLNYYFDQLGFNDTQRKAYMDARIEYFKETDL